MNRDIRLPFFRQRFYSRTKWSVPAARDFVREGLAEWDVIERADEVVLCVSELTTNALLHGVPPGRGFALYMWLRENVDVLHVEVHDSGDGEPRVSEGGHGLRVVEALSDRWGVGERNPGKIVWCEFEFIQ